jgi:hypothetical protein
VIAVPLVTLGALLSVVAVLIGLRVYDLLGAAWRSAVDAPVETTAAVAAWADSRDLHPVLSEAPGRDR